MEEVVVNRHCETRDEAKQSVSVGRVPEGTDCFVPSNDVYFTCLAISCMT